MDAPRLRCRAIPRLEIPANATVIRRDISAKGIAIASAAAVLAGCGFTQTSQDLFMLQRSGAGKPLTIVIGDGGTIRCDGGPAKTISSQLLIQARDLADDLGQDAKARLRVPPRPGSVYSYTIKLQNGTVSFADTAAENRHELARAELFATQAADGPCRSA